MKTFAGVLLLAGICLVAGPHIGWTSNAAHAAALGDLSPFRAIIADTLTFVEEGDLPAAERRITDFETAWDTAEPTMRPLDVTEWTTVDQAADAALEALRVDTPTTDSTLLGSIVNISARLCSLSEGGKILASAAMGTPHPSLGLVCSEPRSQTIRGHHGMIVARSVRILREERRGSSM